MARSLGIYGKGGAIALIHLSLLVGSALAGGETGGGGDICEDRFKTTRDDIKAWINDGGAKDLKLPDTVSKDQYNAEMIQAMQSTHIRCVGPGDVGYPVSIGDTAKICRYDKGTAINEITCDFTKFQSLSDDQRYIQVHHEYAGLANIEPPNGDDSNYQVSNQLADETVEKVIKVLAVKRPTDARTWWFSMDRKYSREDMVENGGATHYVFNCRDSKVVASDKSVHMSLECDWDNGAWLRNESVTSETAHADDPGTGDAEVERTVTTVYDRSNYPFPMTISKKALIRIRDLGNYYEEEELSKSQDGAPADQLLRSTYRFQDDGSVLEADYNQAGQLMYMGTYRPL